MTLALQRDSFPPDLAGVGDHAAADREVGGIAHADAGGQEVQLDAARGVAGVGAAVDLEDDRNGRRGAAEFVGDLGDQATFALITKGDTDIGDELAGKREE